MFKKTFKCYSNITYYYSYSKYLLSHIAQGSRDELIRTEIMQYAVVEAQR